MLESAVRNYDQFHIARSDVENIINWRGSQSMRVPFKPARVVFQDFTWDYNAVTDILAYSDLIMAQLCETPVCFALALRLDFIDFT